MIRNLLEKLGENLHLVTPPGAALRVLEKAGDPDCSFDDLGKLISHDPVLCGKVLKTVNSAMFCPPTKVVSVGRAVRIMGLQSVRALVLGLSLPALGRRGCEDGVARNFWKTAVTGAIVARELSARLGAADPDEDMVAGLLRDLGMMVFYQVYPEEYAALLQSDPDTLPARQCDLETERFGVHHAQVSAELLKHWRLPPVITDPIAYHHRPAADQGCPPAAVRRASLLHFGDAIAQLQVVSGGPAQLHYVLKFAQQHYGINLLELSQFLTPLGQKIATFAAILEVDVGAWNDLGGGLERAVEKAKQLTADADLARTLGVEVPRESALVTADGLLEEAAPAEMSPRRLRAVAAAVGAVGASLCPPLDGHPRYRVQAQLGAGGTGVVFKAEHQLMCRTVAVKLINRSLTRDAAVVDQFHREIRAAARLSHPNIVAAYDAESAGGTHFFVMEYVEGADLARVVSRRGPLPVADACHFARETALGLQHAFEQGMVHRDIKPPNLMVTRKGQLKVLDFGLACLARPYGPPAPGSGSDPARDGPAARAGEDAAGPENYLVVGTPDFIAPEQARDSGDVDIRSDLYSLGCTLYFLLTGRAPFAGASDLEKLLLHWEGTAPPVESLRPDIPAGVAAVVGKLMARRPDERYQTPAQAAEALAPWAALTLPPESWCPDERPGQVVTPASTSRRLPSAETQPEILPAAPAEPARPSVPEPGSPRVLPPVPLRDDELSWWSVSGAVGMFLLSGSLSYLMLQLKDYGKAPRHEQAKVLPAGDDKTRGE